MSLRRISVVLVVVAGLGLGIGAIVGRFSLPEFRALVPYVHKACERGARSAGSYHRSAGGVCYGVWASPIDARSFRDLGNGFAADDRYVYFQGSPVAGTSPATFAIPPGQEPIAGVYATDRDHVFFGCPDCQPPYGQVAFLEAADPAGFTVLTGPTAGYAVDQDQVWLFGIPVPGADAPTFRLAPTGQTYDADDARGRYLQGRRLPAD